MNKIDGFTNLYPLSKTLRFKLIPQGKTAENFDKSSLLGEDEQRAKDYEEVKEFIDRYHKKFIDRVLSSKSLDGLEEYSALYLKINRTEDDKKMIGELSEKMRNNISGWFKADKEFNLLFKSDIIKSILPNYLADDEKELVEKFDSFTTYFTGFHENRKNLYSGEGKSTEIAYRIVNQNLPKYLDNCKSAELAFKTLPAEDKDEFTEEVASKLSVNIDMLVKPLYFNSVMSQGGIDLYNQLIGGFTTDDGRKIKGLNEYINLFNQKSGAVGTAKIPKLKPLFKQILSDRNTMSFIPEKFASDWELLNAIKDFYAASGDETAQLTI